MPSDEIQDRPGYTDLLAELTDSDLVIDVAASGTSRKSPELAAVQRLEEAVAASYRALAGSTPVQLETVAVLEEVAKHSLSLWLRVHSRGGSGGETLAGSADPSLL